MRNKFLKEVQRIQGKTFEKEETFLESIFLTTICSINFSHPYTLYLQITFLHVIDLCGQLACTATTPVFISL